MLRRVADLPRIPPPAEKGVAGKHLKGSTLYDPNVGSEFGFGQNVFKEAAAEINSSGIVKGVDPQIGDLGPDDLQAVVWFIEKENWAKNGWTTKAGEGGSLDYEMSLAGSPEVKRLAKAEEVEMRIVAAGARRDLGEVEAAVVTLTCKELSNESDEWAIRLRYAYADALSAAGRSAEACEWFEKCAALDVDETTDARDRIS
jgi:hypothetical protein